MARNNTLSLPILIFFLLAAAFFPSSSSSSASCNQNDKTALLAFKHSFHYTTLGNWWSDSAATDCCSWKFVGCDSATGRVTSLDFTNDNNLPPSIFLNGSIPSSIGDLSALETLAFNRIPSLSGPIPPHLSKLYKLQSLTIYVTQVSGPVPSFLSRLTSLKQLSLGANMLTGTIPRSLGDLASLTDLNLFGNRLTGPIPSTLFSKLPKGSLAMLGLSGNRLTGGIPSSFGNVDFSQVYLQGNGLTGDVSVLFGESKTVTIVDLSNNDFSFDFSKILFPAKADYIDVSHNRIFGSIPEQITRLPNGTYFDVSYNELCGKIPSAGGKFAQLISQYEHNKCLCGTPLPACK